MCTAATYQSAGFYFGRTLDYEVSYGNQIVITPRNYALRFRHTEDQPHHYAIIGMGLVAEDYPLYYDAMNEKGLCMAGLNFVGNAAYSEPGHDKENVAQFEFIPWLLGQCANLAEAKEKLQNLQLTDTLFNTAMPRAQLHWLIADRTGAVVVESMADGLHLYDNPVGVLTNNPPFPEQMRHLSLYQGLSPCQPENNAVPGAELPLFSRGMGAYGLARRSVLPLPLCESGVYPGKRQIRLLGNCRRQSAAAYFGQCGTTAGLLSGSRGQVRDHPIHQLLQCRHRHLLLHHL